MTLRARAGTAFFWKPTWRSGQASDVMRVVERDGVLLALLANGYDDGFALCWAPGSRLMLDLFVDAWSATSGLVPARLGAAFDVARRAFVERAPSLVAPDADFPDQRPVAILLAAAFDGTTVHIAWVGGDVAVLARGGRAITSTTPHTLVERLVREHPVSELGHVPNVLLRTIGERDEGPPECLSAGVAPGDTLLLLSRSASTGGRLRPEEAAAIAGESASPAAVAERLVGAAVAATDAPYAAVIALRFDDGAR